PLAQCGDGGMAHPDSQPLGTGNLRPPAAGDDCLVLGNRLLGRLRRRRRESRQRRLRHFDGARGRIKTLAEVGVLILIDQGIEQTVVLGGARRAQSRGNGAGRRRAAQERTPVEKFGSIAFAHRVPPACVRGATAAARLPWRWGGDKARRAAARLGEAVTEAGKGGEWRFYGSKAQAPAARRGLGRSPAFLDQSR